MVRSVHQRTRLKTASDPHQQLENAVSCHGPFAAVPASPKMTTSTYCNWLSFFIVQ